MHIEDNWDELDNAARQCLILHDFKLFLSYKSDLKAEGTGWTDAREALRDFICSMNELYLYDN